MNWVRRSHPAHIPNRFNPRSVHVRVKRALAVRAARLGVLGGSALVSRLRAIASTSASPERFARATVRGELTRAPSATPNAGRARGHRAEQRLVGVSLSPRGSLAEGRRRLCRAVRWFVTIKTRLGQLRVGSWRYAKSRARWQFVTEEAANFREKPGPRQPLRRYL